MKYLKEGIEVHNSLNPKIWDKDNHLRPEVRSKLEEIIDEFTTQLAENDIPIRLLDAHIVGSNASYNYTKDSDLDIHLIVNMSELTCDPFILNLLYNYFKSYFNDKYDISIHGIDVELYVEDVNTSSISNGIYSFYEEDWIKFPEPIHARKVDISDELAIYKSSYDNIMKSKDGIAAQHMVDDLYRLRRNSLSKDGEYGIGNLVFKEFRNNGWLDDLKDLAAEGKSKELSLEHLSEAIKDIMSMDSMIEEAKGRGVKPKDLFDSYDYLVDARQFFNYMVKDTQPSYQTGPEKRILNNKDYSPFYKVLLGYLDSAGTHKPYEKIEPATVKKLPNGGLVPLDGRHRSKFCMMLGIPLPVRVLNQEANKGLQLMNSSIIKEARKNLSSTKISSTPKSTLDAPNVIDEIIRGDKYSLADDWDLWQGGGYEYKDLEPQTHEFMNNHLQYTTKPLSRVEMPAYSTKDNTLEIGGIINMGPPRSFSRSIQGTVNILRSDDWDPDDSCILRTTGKAQYFDSRHINDDPRDTFAYQEEVLCGGTFKVVDKTSLIVDDNEYVVYVIKQVSTPKWLTEDSQFLDDGEEFYNYRTALIKGSNIFDTNRGESSFAQDMIELAKSGEEDEYGHTAKYVMMSPREYFEACEKGFGIPASIQIKTVGEHDKDIIQKLETVLDKYKVRFPITYLNYSYNGFTQEGRHRMFIAGQRFGWDTKFPVLVIDTTEEATKARNEENIIRYISKALRDTKEYTFDDFDDIKEQFMYDIERYMDNPKVEFNETDNEYIFIVNGVEYPEDKEEFNFHTPEQKEETNINDMDIEDLLDLDDLSDDDIFNM